MFGNSDSDRRALKYLREQFAGQVAVLLRQSENITALLADLENPKSNKTNKMLAISLNIQHILHNELPSLEKLLNHQSSSLSSSSSSSASSLSSLDAMHSGEITPSSSSNASSFESLLSSEMLNASRYPQKEEFLDLLKKVKDILNDQIKREDFKNTPDVIGALIVLVKHAEVASGVKKPNTKKSENEGIERSYDDVKTYINNTHRRTLPPPVISIV
jgi:hypothetical protein